MAKVKKPKRIVRDVNANVHRIFGEIIERSEQPANRGDLKIAPTPAKKTGAIKAK